LANSSPDQKIITGRIPPYDTLGKARTSKEIIHSLLLRGDFLFILPKAFFVRGKWMMKRKIAISAQTVALVCIFVFLLGRLLLGCDRERETPPARSQQLGDAAPDIATKGREGMIVLVNQRGDR